MFANFVLAALLAAASRPVAAVAPLDAPGFASVVSDAVGARLVELARDSGVFSVFDQRDIETVLRMQKQGAAPLVADPVSYGRMIAARKVITAGISRSGDLCAATLKISDVETGLVEAARTAVAGCGLPDLLHTYGALWAKAVAGKVRVSVVPPTPGSVASVDGGATIGVPFETELAVGRHMLTFETQGYAADPVTIDVGYLAQTDAVFRVRRVLTGRVRIYGSPISAPVFEGAAEIGRLPLDTRLPAGSHSMWVETDAGRFPLSVTVSPDGYTARRIDAPFTALRTFDEKFLEANRAARGGEHAAAAASLDAALRAGLDAQTRLPADTRDEFAAAFAYVQGVRALEQAWIEKVRAEVAGGIEAYCLAMGEAAEKFDRAARSAPASPRLNLAASALARKREPLKLGACAPEARFAEHVGAIEWPAAATAGALKLTAARNRAALAELRRAPQLADAQRRWLKAEESLLAAYEKWSAMALLRDELLRSPSETLPRLCALKRETLGYAAGARKAFGGVFGVELPLQSRLAAIEALEQRAIAQGTLCP